MYSLGDSIWISIFLIFLIILLLIQEINKFWIKHLISTRYNLLKKKKTNIPSAFFFNLKCSPPYSLTTHISCPIHTSHLCI